MSKLESIKTLAGTFDSLVDLTSYCNNQFKVIQKLKEEVKELKGQLDHTKSLLTTTVPLLTPPASVPGVIKVNLSDEENICLIQINKLQEKASSRDLTLEETKKLEILVKSLYLIREKSTQDLNAEYKTLNASSLAQLEQLAITEE